MKKMHWERQIRICPISAHLDTKKQPMKSSCRPHHAPNLAAVGRTKYLSDRNSICSELGERTGLRTFETVA